MSCTNCFAGCVETTSDKCVKYTGDNISFLNISTGDTLESIEEAITDYLATVLTGEGIVPTLTPGDICDAVKANLPCEECGDYTLLEVLTAVIKTICDLEAEIVVERGRIDDLEDDYDVDCLTSDPSDGTHAILQEVITTLCEAIGDITTLNNLYATCITTSTINTYIANYINTISTSNLMYTKMVPYVIYPFYPTSAILGSFGMNGKGSGDWDKIYLCNGNFGTPDLRGRSLIGVVGAMGTAGAYDNEIDPASGNTDYVLGDTAGVNSVILSPSQMAAHTHAATVDIDDPGHYTTIKMWTSETSVQNAAISGNEYFPVIKIEDAVSGDQTDPIIGPYTATTTTLDKTGLDETNVLVTNAENTGGEQGHTNIHPVYAVYYIMFIP